MRRKIISLGIVSFIGLLFAFMPAQKIYAADADKVNYTIDELKDKISLEREAIIADSKKLQEAKKTGDKENIERVKQETNQDIEKRKSTIRAIYRSMEHSTNKQASKKKKKW